MNAWKIYLRGGVWRGEKKDWALDGRGKAVIVIKARS